MYIRLNYAKIPRKIPAREVVPKRNFRPRARFWRHQLLDSSRPSRISLHKAVERKNAYYKIYTTILVLSRHSTRIPRAIIYCWESGAEKQTRAYFVAQWHLCLAAGAAACCAREKNELLEKHLEPLGITARGRVRLLKTGDALAAGARGVCGQGHGQSWLTNTHPDATSGAGFLAIGGAPNFIR